MQLLAPQVNKCFNKTEWSSKQNQVNDDLQSAPALEQDSAKHRL